MKKVFICRNRVINDFYLELAECSSYPWYFLLNQRLTSLYHSYKLAYSFCSFYKKDVIHFPIWPFVLKHYKLTLFCCALSKDNRCFKYLKETKQINNFQYFITTVFNEIKIFLNLSIFPENEMSNEIFARTDLQL